MSKGSDPPRPSGADRFKGVQFEKVNNVWGSTAGAGSDFFHLYRKHRTHEMERLKELDEEDERKREQEDFKKSLEDRQRMAELKTAKNVAKRKKKKDRDAKWKATHKGKSKTGTHEERKATSSKPVQVDNVPSITLAGRIDSSDDDD
eukprot:GHVU01228161.1.p2 GENE.GHVU01228161.1~~GHVU01228161.1.p2  ORF type:complete len:147 (+),score=35.45 GHVU01228161.1:117-557(+)